MKHNKEVQDELDIHSPLLSKMRAEQNGFQLPENYFDYLTESVMEQVKLTPTISTPKVQEEKLPWYVFFGKTKLIVGLATLAILLIAGLFFFNPIEETVDNIAAISATEAAIYVSEHIDEFETNLFMEGDMIEIVSDLELDPAEIDEYIEEIIDEMEMESLEQLL